MTVFANVDELLEWSRSYFNDSRTDSIPPVLIRRDVPEREHGILIRTLCLVLLGEPRKIWTTATPLGDLLGKR